MELRAKRCRLTQKKRLQHREARSSSPLPPKSMLGADCKTEKRAKSGDRPFQHWFSGKRGASRCRNCRSQRWFRGARGGTTPQFFGVELDFDDKIEFCLRKTRFLVMELPRHRGTGLVELQVFISQYPYRSTFFYTYGQNLGCFEMVDLKILKAFDLIS